MVQYGTFLSVTGRELEKAFWPTEGKPRAVVQLVHGMVEHIRRYDATAQALNAAGFAVVGHTHLGHGEKAEIKGWFAQKDGWDALIEDVHTLRRETQAQFPDVPYFLLGHSMGSFVVRCYCLRYEEGLSGVVLSGTGHFDKPILAAGTLLAQLQCMLGMGKKPDRLLLKISSANYLDSYENPQSSSDWLSRDRAEVLKYINDPLCGFTFTAGAYRDMFSGLRRLYPEKLRPMKKDVPVLLFSGDMDPVGGNGAGVKRVADEIRAAGVTDVTVTLYPGGRHEMFNELNREEVWRDLSAWLLSKTNKMLEE